MQELTKARLQEMLDFMPETGVFTWRRSRQGHVKAGRIAGYVRKDGYIKIKIDGTGYFAHRLAWLWVHGEWPREFIDHINGDTSDNRIENLRDVPPVTNSQNERNARKRKNGGDLIGAHWSKVWKLWKSSICIGGHHRHIGWFDTAEQAHSAYVAAKRKFHEGCTI